MTNNQRRGFFSAHPHNENADGVLPFHDFLGTIREIRASQQREQMFEQHKDFLTEIFTIAREGIKQPEKNKSEEEQKLATAVNSARVFAQTNYSVVGTVLESYYGVDASALSTWHHNIINHAAINYSLPQQEIQSIASYLLKWMKANNYQGKIFGYLEQQFVSADSQTRLLVSLAVLEMYSKTTSYAGNFVRAYVQMHYTCYFPNYKEADNKLRIDAVKHLLSGAQNPLFHFNRANVCATSATDNVLLQATIQMVAQFKQGGRYHLMRPTNGNPEMEEFIRYLKEECLEDKHMTNENTAFDAMKGRVSSILATSICSRHSRLINWLATNQDHYAAKVYASLCCKLRPANFSEAMCYAGASREELAEIISKTVAGGKPTADAIVAIYEMQTHVPQPSNYSDVFHMLFSIAAGFKNTKAIDSVRMQNLTSAYFSLREIFEGQFNEYADAVRELIKGIEIDCVRGVISRENRDLLKLLTHIDADKLASEYAAKNQPGGAGGEKAENAGVACDLVKGVAAAVLEGNFYLQNKAEVEWIASNPDHPATKAYFQLVHQLRGNAAEEKYLGGATRQEMIELLVAYSTIGTVERANALITVYEMKMFNNEENAYGNIFGVLMKVCIGVIDPLYVTKSVGRNLLETFTRSGREKLFGRDGYYQKAIAVLDKYIAEAGKKGEISKRGLEVFAAVSGYFITVEAKPQQAAEPQVTKNAEQQWRESLAESTKDQQPEKDQPGALYAPGEVRNYQEEVDPAITTGVLAAATHLLALKGTIELANDELVEQGIQQAIRVRELFSDSKADMLTVVNTLLTTDSFPYLGSYSEETKETGVVASVLLGKEPTAPKHLFTKSCLTELVVLHAVVKQAMAAEKSANA